MREIQAFLAEQYATEVSPEFISSVTDAVIHPYYFVLTGAYITLVQSV
ncbi:MAG: hypothetical protein QM527_07780 [Alphaproteobacteria bacterium]|nr:hypothetical protein [Alphaproteobacteria bacterium]